MSEIKKQAWLRAGYKILGVDGVEGIKVERLARVLKLNKSGFYHYFGTMNTFLERLVQHHVGEANVVAREIAACANLDPDLLLLMIKHKFFFLVEAQLLVKWKPEQFGSGLEEARTIVNQEILPLWRKATKLPEDATVALAYLNIIHHFFYARLEADRMTYEVLHSLAGETKDVLNKVVGERFVTVNTKGKEGPAGHQLS